MGAFSIYSGLVVPFLFGSALKLAVGVLAGFLASAALWACGQRQSQGHALSSATPRSILEDLTPRHPAQAEEGSYYRNLHFVLAAHRGSPCEPFICQYGAGPFRAIAEGGRVSYDSA